MKYHRTFCSCRMSVLTVHSHVGYVNIINNIHVVLKRATQVPREQYYFKEDKCPSPLNETLIFWRDGWTMRWLGGAGSMQWWMDYEVVWWGWVYAVMDGLWGGGVGLGLLYAVMDGLRGGGVGLGLCCVLYIYAWTTVLETNPHIWIQHTGKARATELALAIVQLVSAPATSETND